MKQVILPAILGVAALCACSKLDDAIEATPQDRLTPETYFQNDKQLELYVNRFYSAIVPEGTSIWREKGDATITLPLAEEVTGQREVPETGGNWTWSSLRHINFFFENENRCPDKKAVRKYDAIARVFRAWFYFEKIKRFGDVPWYDKVLDSDDPLLRKPRDSRDVVLENMLFDLDSAITVLARTSKTKDPWHITWWSAQALKSRICLFEGTFRKYHGLQDADKYLEECVKASSAIMKASGGYSLYTTGSQPYRDMFCAATLTPASLHKEWILARDYDETQKVAHTVFTYLNAPGEGRPGLTRGFVNTYLNVDGTRFTDREDYRSLEFKDEINGRDPRLAQTIRTTRGLNLNNCQTGYQLIKYVPDNRLSTTGNCTVDLPVIRYAEVLLNYAEAKAELGTLDQNDLDQTINKLRSRAGITGKLNLSEANADPDPYLSSGETGYVNVTGSNKGVILEIRRERAIELVMEGFRYWDLMRWKEGQCMNHRFEGIYVPASALNTAYDVNGDGTPDVCFYTGVQPQQGSVTYIKIETEEGATGNTLSEGDHGSLVLFGWIDRHWNEDRDYLYPIPREEIVLTDGAVKQNPNW